MFFSKIDMFCTKKIITNCDHAFHNVSCFSLAKENLLNSIFNIKINVYIIQLP